MITTTGLSPGEYMALILGMKTDLTATSWESLQTNYGIISGQSVFSNIPATNVSTFFRVGGFINLGTAA